MVPQVEETTDRSGETFFNRLVGINEAASISRASKGQISRDTQAKKLPFVLDEKGQKRYKVADLYQRYGFRNQTETSTAKSQKPHEKMDETAIELAVFQERLRGQSETIRRMEQEIVDLRQNRDRLLEQNQRLALLLPAPIPPAPLVSNDSERSQEPPKRFPIWKGLFS